jgi:hypothetical protein
LPPASSLLELPERHEIIANFPSEGFRLRLKLVDEAKKEAVKKALMRPSKDMDLSPYIQRLCLGDIVWMGFKPDLD